MKKEGKFRGLKWIGAHDSIFVDTSDGTHEYRVEEIRVDCDAELDVTSDGPLEVNLLGCERSVRTKT